MNESAPGSVVWQICLSTGSSVWLACASVSLLRESLERLGQPPERVGIGCLTDLLEHRVERLACLRLGQIWRYSLERLGQPPERVGIGRLWDRCASLGEIAPK
jgi:hypothetical protein